MDQSKKIATIDVNTVNKAEPVREIEFEPIDWRTAFLDEHHSCPLCGSELLLTNVTHFVDQKVREEAFCESCNIRTRHADHSLQ